MMMLMRKTQDTSFKKPFKCWIGLYPKYQAHFRFLFPYWCLLFCSRRSYRCRRHGRRRGRQPWQSRLSWSCSAWVCLQGQELFLGVWACSSCDFVLFQLLPVKPCFSKLVFAAYPLSTEHSNFNPLSVEHGVSFYNNNPLSLGLGCIHSVWDTDITHWLWGITITDPQWSMGFGYNPLSVVHGDNPFCWDTVVHQVWEMAITHSLWSVWNSCIPLSLGDGYHDGHHPLSVGHGSVCGPVRMVHGY